MKNPADKAIYFICRMGAGYIVDTYFCGSYNTYSENKNYYGCEAGIVILSDRTPQYLFYNSLRMNCEYVILFT